MSFLYDALHGASRWGGIRAGSHVIRACAGSFVASFVCSSGCWFEFRLKARRIFQIQGHSLSQPITSISQILSPSFMPCLGL